MICVRHLSDFLVGVHPVVLFDGDTWNVENDASSMVPTWLDAEEDSTCKLEKGKTNAHARTTTWIFGCVHATHKSTRVDGPSVGASVGRCARRALSG